jgi:nitrate reductase gamma subunit
MIDIYNFVSGPLVWVSFILFFGGSIYKLVKLILLVKEKENFIFSYMSLKYSLRSIFHWMIPFGSVNMRNHPVMTIVTFAFHICLILTPAFLMAHILLFDEAWKISWISLPDSAADIMTLIVIGSSLFFLARRIMLPEVKFVTSLSDYIILLIVAAPFITGFFAYHQWFGYPVFMILHIVSGEIMLVAIPFTRLSHMLFAPLTRAYIASEFGGVRHANDW